MILRVEIDLDEMREAGYTIPRLLRAIASDFADAPDAEEMKAEHRVVNPKKNTIIACTEFLRSNR